MATYNKFQDYVEQVNKAVHDWSSHTFKAQLSNTAPDAAADAVEADLPADLAGGNGYTANGVTLDTVSLSEASGTAKVTIADEVVTASGGSVGPFRYVPIFNDTPTSPADPVVCYFDYGSSITLLSTETFTMDFDATNGLWQMV
jgi:hypothetical protein